MQILSKHKKLEENYVKMKIHQEISKPTTCANNISKQTYEVVAHTSVQAMVSSNCVNKHNSLVVI